VTVPVSDDSYRKTVLDNGVRVVTETMPHVRSLAIGAWFDVGSRDEPEEVSGIAHFLEHMNFKGTKRRSALAIVREIEGRGGHLNAFTSKEVTCFHARVTDNQVTRALNVLADITMNSVYDSDELKRERKVIFEELKNVEDTPDELVFERFVEQVYSGHPMGRSVLGRRETLKAINRSRLQRYRDTHYTSGNLVVAAAGMLNHTRLVNLVERHFQPDSTPRPARNKPRTAKNDSHRQDLHTNTQQAHICWGCRAFKFNDPRRYSLLILNTLLGGGMSSRLFQQIREKHGLAYAVFSFAETYQDTGIFGIYAGTEPARADLALDLMNKIISDLVRKPVPASELQRTKDSLKGNILLSLESPGARMNRLAKMELYTDEWQTLDDVIACINAVTADDVQTLATDLFDDKAAFTTILWPN
jgi:predicted Zn-dependent peptidase